MNYITKNSTIIIDPLFDEELDLRFLTNNIQRIIFSDYDLEDKLFDGYEKNYLLIFLYPRSNFNHPVNSLPSSITHLTFGYNFNHTVDYLPSSITHLTFSWKFNQPVDNLSSSLQYLKFGYSFNQPISNLPSSLTYLTFGRDHNVEKIVCRLGAVYDSYYEYYEHCHTVFNQPLNNLPPNLEYIQLPIRYENQICDIPPRLRIIKCSSKYVHLNDFIGLEGLDVIKY